MEGGEWGISTRPQCSSSMATGPTRPTFAEETTKEEEEKCCRSVKMAMRTQHQRTVCGTTSVHR